MTMTTVGGIIDVGGMNYNISNFIVEMDLWREALNGVGRWEVVIGNPNNAWGGTFTTYMEVSLSINGIVMMRGWVDDVKPFLDRKGEYTNMLRLSGKDYGIDLLNLFYTNAYFNTASSAIITAVLAAAGSGIVRVGPAAPAATYEWDRTFLQTGITDLAEEVSYDFYVDDTAGAPQLHFFDIATMWAGAEHTAVNLLSDVGGATNNILNLEEGEQIGVDIRNHIVGHTGYLDDHWTEGNATAPTAHWTPGPSCTVQNEPAIQLSGVGKTAIRVNKSITDGNPLFMTLTFPRYSYDATWGRLDLSDEGVISYYFYLSRAVPPSVPPLDYFSIELVDNNGNIIQWYKSPGIAPARNNKNYVNFIPNQLYYTVQTPIGTDVDITPFAAPVSDWWWYSIAPPAPPFNWTDIRAINFTSSGPPGAVITPNLGAFAVVDRLSIPNVEVRSIAVDGPGAGTSITLYGRRMENLYVPKITSQIELDYFTARRLATSKDPLVTLEITASGQTGNHYAAQSLDVRAPSHGIGVLTPYRIMKLHHSVKLSPERNEYPGYDFITEYSLVRHQVSGVDQIVNLERIDSYKNPFFGRVEGMNNKNIHRIPFYRKKGYWA